MTIQDNIVDILTRSLQAHRRAVAAIKALRIERSVLETEVVELKARIRLLEVAAARAAEASLLQTELDAIERLIAEFAAVPLGAAPATDEARPADA